MTDQLTLKASAKISLGDLVRIKSARLLLNTFFFDGNNHNIPDQKLGIVIDIYADENKNDDDNIKTKERMLYYIYTSSGTLDAFDFEIEVLAHEREYCCS